MECVATYQPWSPCSGIPSLPNLFAAAQATRRRQPCLRRWRAWSTCAARSPVGHKFWGWRPCIRVGAGSAVNASRLQPVPSSDCRSGRSAGSEIEVHRGSRARQRGAAAAATGLKGENKYRPVYLPEQISRLLGILESVSQLNTDSGARHAPHH